MPAYLARRLALAAATILTATFLTFLMLRLVPGEPAQIILTRIFLQDTTATVSAADVQAIARRFGLDAPIIVQYGRWLGAALAGDLGVSLRTGRPVATELGWRLSATGLLAVLSSAAAIGLALAFAAAQRLLKCRLIGPVADGIALIAIALPSFYLGVVLIIALSLKLDLLPVSGFESWAHVVLPVAVLAAGQFGFILVVMSGALDEAYDSQHMVTAKAKGLSDRAIFAVHAMPNALVPLIPYLALQFAFLIGGVVVVERLFSIPGLGAYLTDALDSHDGPAFLGAIGVVALAVSLCNLAADLAVAAIDPRIRRDRGGSP